MNLKDTSKLLANRINQEHYVYSQLLMVFKKGYETGVSVENQNSIDKFMSYKSEYHLERICKHLPHHPDFFSVERSAKFNNELPLDHLLSLVANKLDELEDKLTSIRDSIYNI